MSYHPDRDTTGPGNRYASEQPPTVSGMRIPLGRRPRRKRNLVIALARWSGVYRPERRRPF